MEASIVFAFLAAGFLLILAGNYLNLGFGEATKAALLVIPLAAYLIITNRVGEADLLGIKLKFVAIAESKVVAPAELANLLISSEEANKPNFVKDNLLRPCRPYYVIPETFLPKPLENQSEVLQIARQVRHSILCGAFQALVVVDSRFQPIGVLETAALQEMLRIRLVTRNGTLFTGGADIESADIFKEILMTEFGLALTNPRFQAEKKELAKHVFVNTDASVEQTYGDLLAAGAQVAAITDRRGQFVGIVTRNAIEGWIIQQTISTIKQPAK